jgi:4-amino-4-deoxychorismate lyase
MIECLVNGQILEHIHVSDRGLNYGDGLFETIAVVQGQPRWWQDHIDRLSAGCDRLGLHMPAQAILLREVQTVSAGQHRCVVKITLSRGPGDRGYTPYDGAEQTRLVSSHSWPLGLEQAVAGGVDARTCDLKLAIQPQLGGMKHLNRLEQVLASREMLDYPGMEGILLDTDDHLISTISANLFMVFKEQLMTPRLDRCGVRGVLRARILKAFKSRCELRRISSEMLAEASEIFLCSSLRGIVPVNRIDSYQYSRGPVTHELLQWLSEVQAG